MSKRPRNVGWIYILSNPAFRYLKVGATTSTPNQRCYQLSKSTATPFHFDVEYSALVSEVFAQERKLHDKLVRYKVSKEFYDMDLSTATLIADMTLRKLSTEHDPIRKVAEVDYGEVNLEN